jgi:hypothetical protein
LTEYLQGSILRKINLLEEVPMSRNQLSKHAALLTLLFLLLGSTAAYGSVAGAHSLQIPPGAKANGLGMASVALADDATAAWWNPAGLGFLHRTRMGLMHSQLVPDLADDIYYEFGSWVQELQGWGTISFNTIYLSYGKSPITHENSEVLGYFHSYEFSPSISYGVTMGPNTAVGLSLKYVRVDLAPKSAILDPGAGEGAGHSVAVDIGFLWRTDTVSLGGVLNNFGPNISFIDAEQSDPLPRHLKLGAAYYVMRHEYGHVMATLDFNKMLVAGGPTIWNGGVELGYADIMAFRLGRVQDPDGDITDFTFGGGFHVNIGSRELYLDYASVPQASDLDRVHRLSIEVLF